MIKNTLKIFFELVRAGLWSYGNQDLDEIDDDWGEVYRLAEEQSVVGLIAAGVEEYRIQKLKLELPQAVALKFIGSTLQAEQQNKAMNAFIADLIERLCKVGIYAILVKGQGVAQCYEKPLWRSSGDVDLLLNSDNYERAKAFLLPMCEVVEPEGVEKKHLALKIGQWEVELHGTLRVGLSSRVDRALDKVQKDIFYGGQVRLWMDGNTQVFLPGANEDVVYVFAHVLQHFYKGGIGLRQICDWCRLLYTFRDSLNLELLESRIKEMGLIGEWKAFGTFAVEYLGMPIEEMPFLETNNGIDANLKRKAELIKDFVMEVGNFGHNRDNSYFQKHSYFVQKCISAWRRVKDLCRHARIFPANSLRFFFGIMWNGVVSAARGE